MRLYTGPTGLSTNALSNARATAHSPSLMVYIDYEESTMNGNTITVVGNLTKDPVLKYLPTGKAVINFTVACNHGWRDKETQSWVDGDTTFFKVECWDSMAENISETLRKGDPAVVVGRMSCRTYEVEGQSRESWEIRAETVGPDLRRRAASLRKVLRNAPPDNPPTSDSADFDGTSSSRHSDTAVIQHAEDDAEVGAEVGEDERDDGIDTAARAIGLDTGAPDLAVAS